MREKIKPVAGRLVLTRHVGQSITIGDDITVSVVSIGTDKVKIGIIAPDHVRILRDDAKIREEKKP